MKTEGKVYEGPISMTRTGLGFFKIEDKETDLFIPREDTLGAFHGDTVKVEETGVQAGKPQGRVIEIVEKSRTTFVGTLFENKEEGLLMIHPDWKKMYVPFVVKGENLPIGHKILIRYKGWDLSQPYPWGEFMEDIGPAGLHDTEMRAIALSQGFESSFPPGVEKEASHLEENGKSMLAEGAEKEHRRDFRGITTFTIDPFDAKDFDDALSVRELENGNVEVGVHIADVSYFVRTGSSIDTEARKRATSVYLVDRTIPMLPHVLSTNLCSLVPNEDRLSMSAVFELDRQAGIVNVWFGETVMHSDKRFTYEEAQEVLEKKDGPFLKELEILNGLSKIIRERRTRNGAIAFDTPEVKVELDQDGKPVAIKLKERKDTNLLIEDFMLLANEAVAKHLSDIMKKKNLKNGSIYRVHDVPDAERIEDLAQFLKVLGYELPVKGGKVKGADINNLLASVVGKPEEYLIKTAALRSMAKATYTTKNNGHFGLAFEFYTHFTSPIRRYPDLLIHRLLKHVSGGDEIAKKDWEDLEHLSEHSSEREVSAAEAERDSIKLKQVEFLADKIGQEFDAVISGVNERGLFVEEQTTRADGMIRLRDMNDDFYSYDPKRYRLVGEKTQKQYSLGDPVKVKLVAARVFERELDFAFV